MMPTIFHPRTVKHTRTWLCMCTVVALLLPATAFADAPLDPLPVPEYSFDSTSPTVQGGIVECADILSLAFPHPASLLPRLTLGLESPLDDIDALSASNASVDLEDPFDLLFSVDRDSTGVASPAQRLLDEGIPYNMKDQAWRGQHAGDQFISTEAFTRLGEMTGELIAANNYLVRNNFDEGGTDFGAEPTTHAYDIVQAVPQDRVDATARLVDGEGEIPHAYFSLTSESPSLLFLGGGGPASGATIYHACPMSSVTGACCFGDSACTILTEIECMSNPGAEGGLWLGPNTTCDMCEFPMEEPEGACCRFDRTCDIVSHMSCWDGRWLGPGSICAWCDMPEETGACCFPDDFCEIMTPSECYGGPGMMGGVWLGPDTTCGMCDVPPMEGPCCYFDGGCAITTPETCIEGAWLGPGFSCDECDSLPADGMYVDVYAAPHDLGLIEADNIDAIIVFDNDEDGCFDGTDQVLFSLSADSPSLGTIPGASGQGAAADVFVVRHGQEPMLFTAAASLGLGAPSDDIDALDHHPIANPFSKMTPAVRYGIRAPAPEKKLRPQAKNLSSSSLLIRVQRAIQNLGSAPARQSRGVQSPAPRKTDASR